MNHQRRNEYKLVAPTAKRLGQGHSDQLGLRLSVFRYKGAHTATGRVRIPLSARPPARGDLISLSANSLRSACDCQRREREDSQVGLLLHEKLD